MKLDFTPEAVEEVADKAIEMGTGARALRSIMEKIMLDIMYSLPDSKKKSVLIDADAVEKAFPKK